MKKTPVYGLPYATVMRIRTARAARRGFSFALEMKVASLMASGITGFLLLGAQLGRADTHYVSPDGTNDAIGGYTNWVGAATNIQLAVDAADPNDTVLVSNGIYTINQQISITKAGLILKSLEGRTETVINGNYPCSTNRCVYLNGSGATLDGFTVSNGCFVMTVGATYIGGGGIHAYNGIVKNCTIINNLLDGQKGGNAAGGGGVCMSGTGNAFMTNCLVLNNTAISNTAGGVYVHSSKATDCVISGNTARSGAAYAGAAYSYAGKLLNSEILNNWSEGSGGGVALQAGATVSNCIFRGNVAKNGSGSGVYSEQGGYILKCTLSEHTNSGSVLYLRFYGNVVNNSIISNNYAKGIDCSGPAADQAFKCNNTVVCYNQQGGVGLYHPSYMRNCLIIGNSGMSGVIIWESCTNALISGCTIVSNSYLSSYGGGLVIRSTNMAMISSCIICSNSSASASYPDIYDLREPLNSNTVAYCCLGKRPASFTGPGIIEGNPRFLDFAGGNYRLAVHSPCINKGFNENWMTNSLDLDGKARIRNGTVDMGAYERPLLTGSTLSVH
ncbi:MAG: right-handed parallel beta-helix repeat-containing protein [Kiritimatiellae bacterium]|nr:right-handed parallel beta-helix repeat-containing protein [Kiritimatiellia bacterium]